MKLWKKILLAMVLGTTTGLLVGPRIEILKPIGTLFLNLINMVIVPLVLASMIAGITSIHDPKKLGRIGSKTVLFYLATTIVSILFGFLFGSLFEPGVGLGLTNPTAGNITEIPKVVDLFLSIVPTNPVAALASGNILQIIVFSAFLGVAISFSGEKGKPLLNALSSLADVMYRLTAMIMQLAPIGVFAIMAWVAGSFGIAMLIPLAKFLLVYYAACAVHVIIVFCGMLKFMGKVQPLPFFKGMGNAMMVAFSTCSSSAALPTSMHCAQANLGISKNIASFVLPMGSAINMNGTAIFHTMGALFVAQAYGIELSVPALVTIMVTSTFSAISAPGVPGSGIIMLSAVLASVGLPLEGVAILAGVDQLRSMVGTVLNVTGDAVVAVCIAKQEGELNEQQYYSPELVHFTQTS